MQKKDEERGKGAQARRSEGKTYMAIEGRKVKRRRIGCKGVGVGNLRNVKFVARVLTMASSQVLSVSLISGSRVP